MKTIIIICNGQRLKARIIQSEVRCESPHLSDKQERVCSRQDRESGQRKKEENKKKKRIKQGRSDDIMRSESEAYA